MGAASQSKGSPSAHLNTHKIDTTSSVKSGEESAPEPPQPESQQNSGLARVTSYNKLERNIEEDDLDSS